MNGLEGKSAGQLTDGLSALTQTVPTYIDDCANKYHGPEEPLDQATYVLITFRTMHVTLALTKSSPYTKLVVRRHDVVPMIKMILLDVHQS